MLPLLLLLSQNEPLTLLRIPLTFFLLSHLHLSPTTVDFHPRLGRLPTPPTMASHDDETMPDQTEGYTLSQPKQSMAQYQQMGR